METTFPDPFYEGAYMQYDLKSQIESNEIMDEINKLRQGSLKQLLVITIVFSILQVVFSRLYSSNNLYFQSLIIVSYLIMAIYVALISFRINKSKIFYGFWVKHLNLNDDKLSENHIKDLIIKKLSS